MVHAHHKQAREEIDIKHHCDKVINHSLVLFSGEIFNSRWTKNKDDVRSKSEAKC